MRENPVVWRSKQMRLKLAEKYQRSAGILILQDAQSKKETKQIAYENSKRLWHQWYISRIDS